VTYLQWTLVDHLQLASFDGRDAIRAVDRGLENSAAYWARAAWTHATAALHILEHELTDDVTSDRVPS
jgi:hypothetical protein